MDKKNQTFTQAQSVRLSQYTEVILKSSDYYESAEIIHPSPTIGYSLEQNEIKELCPFYNLCLAENSFDTHVFCIKSEMLICRQKMVIRNLSD